MVGASRRLSIYVVNMRMRSLNDWWYNLGYIYTDDGSFIWWRWGVGNKLSMGVGHNVLYLSPCEIIIILDLRN